MPHGSGPVHLHQRKRLFKNLEPWPHPNALKRALDSVVYVASVVGPFATLPQVYQIYVHNHVEGVSLHAWALYALLSLIWLFYGIVHKETPIIISNSLNLVLNISVAIGVLIYA